MRIIDNSDHFPQNTSMAQIDFSLHEIWEINKKQRVEAQ